MTRMNRPAAAWFAGLLVGAATATAAWVRLAGHPPTARAQLAAIRLGIRALEALPTKPRWDDEDGHEWPFPLCQADSPGLRTQTGIRGGSEPARPAQARTGCSGAVTTHADGGYVPGYTDAEAVAAIIRRDEPRITEAAVRSYAAAWLEGRIRERNDP